MVDLYLNGRLGNNLFQYSLGRIIAEHLNYKLNIFSSPEKSHIEAFINITILDGSSYEHPIETYKGHIINLEEILKNLNNRKICLRGYFQRYEYYKNYKNQIKKWLKISPSLIKTSPNSLAVHMRPRLNEPGTGKASLRYYCDILSTISYDRVYVLGTGIDNLVIDTFKKYNPIYINNGEIEDFKFIKSCKKIIMSNSTFCWWAAWLSDATEIYYPRTKTGYWSSERPDINLIIDDEPRYHLIIDKE